MLGYLLISILVLVFVLGEMIGLYIQCENCYHLQSVKKAVIFIPIIKTKLFWKCFRISFKKKSIAPLVNYIKIDNKGLRILVKLAKIKENCKISND